MPNTLFSFSTIVFAGLLSACAATSPLYQPSKTQLSAAEVNNYDAYLNATRRHLEQNLVALPGFQRSDQIEWNMPFRNSLPGRCSDAPSRGLLLVHGLSDSPFVFRDIAGALAEDCIHVRTVLLQGHGTRPGDMIDARAGVWREQVRTHFNALAREVDIALIGGFSLGGALATEIALSDESPRPAGLVAIAPAWELNGLDNYLWLASTADLLLDFVEKEPELNPVKYESLTFNAAAQLADVLKSLRRRFDDPLPSDLPLFLVAAEADSVINLPYLIDSFETRFNHPDNRMMIFRDQRREWPYPQGDKVTLIDSYRPDLNILEFSHQSLLASPENELYGLSRPLQHCLEPNRMTLEECHALRTGQIWYSAWSDQEQSHPTSRLTYNPSFEQLSDALSEFIRTRDMP